MVLISAILATGLAVVLLLRTPKKSAEPRLWSKMAPAVSQLGLLSLIPAALLVGQFLRFGSAPYLLTVSAVTVIAFALTAALLHDWQNRCVLGSAGIASGAEMFRLGGGILLGTLFLFLSETGVAVFLSRFQYASLPPTGSAPLFGLILFSLFALRRRVSPRPLVSRYLLLTQLGAPLLFLIFLSPPLVLPDRTVTTFSYSPVLYGIVGLAVALGYIDLARRGLHRWKQDTAAPEQSASLWTITAGLLLFTHVFVSYPAISIEEYRVGETYLPWWLLVEHGRLPFSGYQPPRGLIDYLPGFVNWLLGDNTFSGMTLTAPHAGAILALLVFFCLRRLIGSLAAFLATASAATFANLSGDSVILSAAALALFFSIVRARSPLPALWGWAGIFILLTGLSIQAGGLFLLATLPLLLDLLLQALRFDRFRLLVSLAILGTLGIVVYLVPPLNRMFFGGVSDLLVQLGIDSVAHAAPYAFTQGSGGVITGGILWQFFRFSWLFLLAAIGMQIEDFGWQSLQYSDLRLRWYLLLAVGILAVFFIPGAAGRLVSAEDTGIVPVLTMMVIFGVPLAVLPFLEDYNSRARWLLGLALLIGFFGAQEKNLAMAWNIPRQTVEAPGGLVSGSTLGLNGVGEQVVMDPAQIQRQQEIQQTLDALLLPTETYYDATNRPADYALQGRPNPTLHTAFSAAPALSQQLQAIEQIETQETPLVLAEGENLLPHGEPMSLRSFWLYAYLLQRYQPFEDPFGRIWMVRLGQEYRLDGSGYELPELQEQMELLQRAFHQENLGRRPAAWGFSFPFLQKDTRDPVDLLPAVSAEPSPVIVPSGADAWEVTGDGAHFIFNVPLGAHGDMLLLETAEPVTGGAWTVDWTSDLVESFADQQSFFTFDASGARYLIPLSSAPSYLQSYTIHQIRVTLPQSFRGRVALRRVTLYTRANP